MKQEQDNRTSEIAKLMDTSSVLQIRLDTSYVLDRVRIFLSGEIQSVVYDEQGKPKLNIEKKTEPKCNSKGLHAILNLVENIVNPATVQGNFDENEFDTYIDFVWTSLIDNLMINLHDWEISESDYESIIDNVMAVVIPFMTRTLKNLERESYAQSLKTLESSNITQSKNKIFGG